MSNKVADQKKEKKPQFKSGIVTIIGRSNSGKSTLLNTLVGTKITAVSDKPQTTRQVIHGVLNEERGQIVFVDTPGVFNEPHTLLAGKLIKSVHEAIKQIDLVVYIADPTKSIGPEERYILALLRHLTVPKIMVINKSDLPAEQKQYLTDYRDLSPEFNAVFELSALRHRHIQPLVEKVLELLPTGEPLYPPGQLTNIDKNFWVAEIIREKIFLALRKEVPYTTHVEVISIEEKDARPRTGEQGESDTGAKPRTERATASSGTGVFVIKAIIYTYDSRYKKMIIGAGGRAIKEIGIAARKELEQALNKKVFLELEVETDKHWMEKI